MKKMTRRKYTDEFKDEAVNLEAATGIPSGVHKVATLMSLAGVQVKRRKKSKATTNSKHEIFYDPLFYFSPSAILT
jgi:transposase-like protein